MPFNFDEIIERRSSGALKWNLYDADVLPLWVADTDFRVPEPITRALHNRIDHGIFGYQFNDPALRQTIVQRTAARYNWTIAPDEICFVPNLVAALNFVCLAYAEPGDEVLVQTPVYPPFIAAPTNGGRVLKTADLALTREGHTIRYEIDFDAFEAAITPRTKMFILCSPHNPVGCAWTRPELERLAEICLRHNLVIVSDEIHCDLLLDGQQHIPIASLSPEVAARTVTMMSPSKTFNLPTLAFAFLAISNEELRKKFEKVTAWYLPHPGAIGFTAAQAAYTECDEWLNALLPYLAANRDYLVQYVGEHLPNITVTRPEATYLAWLDFRALGLDKSPHDYLVEKARVGLNDGAAFGKAGEGFVRLNYGTPRATLAQALDRIRTALQPAQA